MRFRGIVVWTGVIAMWLAAFATVAFAHTAYKVSDPLPVADSLMAAAQAGEAELSVERAAVSIGVNCLDVAQALEAPDEQSVAPGGYVVTDGLGRARIDLAGGVSVTLYHDSCLQLADIDRLNLFEGTLVTQPGQEAVAVMAGDAAIEATGRVLIHLLQRRGLWVVVQDGAASVDAGGSKVSLATGQQTWMEPGEALVEAKPNERDVVGDRFFLIDDLTNDVIQDADLLAPPTLVRPPGIPWGLVVAFAVVAGGAVVIAALSRRRGAAAGDRDAVRGAGEVVGLRQVNAAGYGDLIQLRQGGLTIGRAPNNSLVLNDSRVSARHARILARPDGYYLEDLRSTNGTFVDGQRVSRRPLQHGDVIRFDRYQFVFQHGPQPPVHAEASPPSPPPQPIPRAGVRLHDGSESGRFIPIDRDGLTLGRDASNDVVLQDPRASAHHARIIATAQGFFIEDLGSTNGTLVKGQRVTRQHLQGGETIYLGQSQMVFEINK